MRPVLVLLTVLFASSSTAQEIYANPENLEVLPEDISPADLRNTMRMFALGTGSRCETCHVGEAGQPLTTFDFASDEKEHKEIARRMMLMTNAINTDHVGRLDGDPMLVTCETCHRGVQVPKTTGQVLAEALAEGGPVLAEARYRELRAAYYGTHSYDFSEMVLTTLAQDEARADRLGHARALLMLNAEFFPESFATWYFLGEVAARAGKPVNARAHFERAIEIGGPADFVAHAQRRIQELPED